MGTLRILDYTGDTEKEFTPENHSDAMELFDKAIGNGSAGFKLDESKKTTPTYDKIDSFDPNAKEIIITRPMKGG